MLLRPWEALLANGEPLPKLEIRPLAIPALHKLPCKITVVRTVGLHEKAPPVELHVLLDVRGDLELVLPSQVKVRFAADVAPLWRSRMILLEKLKLPLNPRRALSDLFQN